MGKSLTIYFFVFLFLSDPILSIVFSSMFVPFCVVVLTAVAAVAQAKKPNLVFALVDDLGWNGVGECRVFKHLRWCPWQSELFFLAFEFYRDGGGCVPTQSDLGTE